MDKITDITTSLEGKIMDKITDITTSLEGKIISVEGKINDLNRNLEMLLSIISN